MVTKKDQQDLTSWNQSHISYLHNHVKTKIFYTGIFEGWLILLYRNGPIWADAVAGENSVSRKCPSRKFSFLHGPVGTMSMIEFRWLDVIDLFFYSTILHAIRVNLRMRNTIMPSPIPCKMVIIDIVIREP